LSKRCRRVEFTRHGLCAFIGRTRSLLEVRVKYSSKNSDVESNYAGAVSDSACGPRADE